jgi:hypothetical protein
MLGSVTLGVASVAPAYALTATLGIESIADLATDTLVNIITCLAFIAGSTWIAYRGISTTERLQIVLVGFQMLVLAIFTWSRSRRRSPGSCSSSPSGCCCSAWCSCWCGAGAARPSSAARRCATTRLR